MYFNKKEIKKTVQGTIMSSNNNTNTHTQDKKLMESYTKKHTQLPLFNNIYEISIVLMNAHARKQQLKCIYYY